MPMTSDGGKPNKVDVMNYATPYGPTNINDGNSPGLHGDNYGCGQQPAGSQTGGTIGLGGKNYSNSGTQGKR